MNKKFGASSDVLGSMPVGKLIVRMSVPLMISMIVQAGYNLVDSIFVAGLNEAALTAVSLSFPIQIAMIGIAVGTSVGVGALTSRRFGESKTEDAGRVAQTGIVLAAVSWLVMAVLILFGADSFVGSQINDPIIIAYATTYIKICGILGLGVFQQIMLGRLLQCTGKTMLSMYCQLSGVLINIIMDPILIFGYFGMPRMEVAGAAIATVMGQLFGMLVGIILNLRYNRDISFLRPGFRLKGDIIKEIYKIGIPSTVVQIVGSVMVMVMNRILLSVSSTAVAVFGAYFKINGFVFMPVFAMNSALTPIISYNYGAGNTKRIREAVKTGSLISIFIMLLGTAIFQIFPAQLLAMFKPGEKFLEIGIPAMRTISWIFPMVGLSISMAALFQSVGRPYYSLITTFIRQIVVLLPTAYIFGKIFGITGIWWSFLVAEIVALIMVILFRREIDINILSKLDKKGAANAS